MSEALVPVVVEPPKDDGGRDPKTGRFTRGITYLGRTPGSLNKVNKAAKAVIAEAIASGARKHPAEVLLDLANDTEMPAGVRRAAAADLLPYLWPQKKSLELELPELDTDAEARIATVRTRVARLFMAEIIDEKLP
jgi:hypothetical protein